MSGTPVAVVVEVPIDERRSRAHDPGVVEHVRAVAAVAGERAGRLGGHLGVDGGRCRMPCRSRSRSGSPARCVEPVVAAEVPAAAPDEPSVHPASAARPAPPSSPSADRRATRVRTSNSRPRSWSGCTDGSGSRCGRFGQAASRTSSVKHAVEPRRRAHRRPVHFLCIARGQVEMAVKASRSQASSGPLEPHRAADALEHDEPQQRAARLLVAAHHGEQLLERPTRVGRGQPHRRQHRPVPRHDVGAEVAGAGGRARRRRSCRSPPPRRAAAGSPRPARPRARGCARS